MNEEKTSTSKPRNAHCKRLPADASKEERKNAHLVKMTAKKIVNQRLHEQMSGPAYIRANISAHHEDSGMSPAEHIAAKSERNQGA
jgi:hypothetical protein